MEGKTIKIKLVRSTICAPEKQKAVVRGLGLRKLNQVVEKAGHPGLSWLREESAAPAGAG